MPSSVMVICALHWGQVCVSFRTNSTRTLDLSGYTSQLNICVVDFFGRETKVLLWAGGWTQQKFPIVHGGTDRYLPTGFNNWTSSAREGIWGGSN